MHEHEEWRVIPGFPDYEASSLGNIRRATPGRRKKPGSVLAQTAGRYLYVGLFPRDGGKVIIQSHILIATAFHGPRPFEGAQVAHFDGDPLNNRAENLRWATGKENMADRARHGRQASFLGETNPLCAHADDLALRVIETHRTERLSYGKLAERFGISKSQAFRICTGKSRSYLTQSEAA